MKFGIASLLAVVLTIISLTANLRAQSAKADTVFLLKEFSGIEHHNIFIDPINPPDAIRGENLKEILNSYLPNLISELGRAGVRVKHLSGHAFPRRWVELHQYQGKLYRYQPCDGSDNHVFITDSTVVQYGMESFQTLLQSVEWTGDSLFRITSNYGCTNCNDSISFPGDSLIGHSPSTDGKGGEPEISIRRKTATIHILDRATKLALWEEGLGWGLMVPAENAAKFPIIVCDCGPDPAADAEFGGFEEIELSNYCKNGVPKLQGQDRGYSRRIPVPEAVAPTLTRPH